jgi:tRNA nucleotidyltransferase/poly(A) polymerase
MHRGDLGKIEIAIAKGKGSAPGTMSDVHEDLRRRDFTINAMACRLSTGELLDPFSGRRT